MKYYNIYEDILISLCELIEIIEDAIYYEIYGGCEPEFDTDYEYDSFKKLMDNLDLSHYKYTIDNPDSAKWDRKSPYLDKTIPYLKYYESNI